MNNRSIEWYGDNAIISTDDIGFTFESVENPREFNSDALETESLDWMDRDFVLNEYTVYPYGNNNDLPKVIKEVVQNNYIAPGILKKKTQLLWGKGPKLYEEKYDEGVLVREWGEHKEIKEWMES